MKYSFLMPYFDRSSQLYNTLISFKHHYSKRSDYEIILIEDTKNNDGLHKVVASFNNFFSIYIFPGDDKPNPSTAFNVAATKAKGEYLVITNPECFHQTNILDAMDKSFAINPDSYFVCACRKIIEVKPKRIKDISDLKYRATTWFQHSKRNNNCFHFCTAIKASSYPMFDERYSDGVAYDDIAFRETLKSMNIKFVTNDKALVLHQKHSKDKTNRGALAKRNKNLYKEDHESNTA